MGKGRDSEALDLLKRIAHQVQPIMRRREWRVPLLSEFFPSNPNLLGLNIGGGGGRTREIRVRLRPARNPDSFLPYESLLCTMLHELVHNVRGPHDSVFYKLLDELTAECEELMARGVGGTGVGFDGPSCGRLGSHAFIPQHNPPEGRLRDYALRAAEERAKRQRIMTSGPRRLGGGSGPRYANPGAAAAAAAERRCRDNRWCPCERLAGALNRALAEEAAVEAGTAVAAAGNGATRISSEDAGGGSADSTHSAGPAGQAAPSGAARPAQLTPSRRRAEEVEEELVRRIEDGAIDLTADSDSDSDSGARAQGTLRVEHSGPGRSGRVHGGASGVTLVTRAPVASSLPVKRERTGKGRSYASDGGGGGSSCGAAGATRSLPPRDGREADRGSGNTGGCGHGVSLAGPHDGAVPDGGDTVETGGTGGGAGRSQVATNSGSGRPMAQPHTAPGARQGPLSAAQARPPLQVLRPRNPVAAAAAAAALARMQTSSGPGAEALPSTGPSSGAKASFNHRGDPLDGPGLGRGTAGPDGHTGAGAGHTGGAGRGRAASGSRRAAEALASGHEGEGSGDGGGSEPSTRHRLTIDDVIDLTDD